ncbi:ComEC/Rec2 family competence protein [Virgisporangium ochraceum]|uniref:ComEC/Rec2 family competence protein n=1 Tax=Virgisporangium ochraceum TaxID=65505 RepID=UPI0035A249A1
MPQFPRTSHSGWRPMASISILDCGHGNCAVIQSANRVIVVDAPRRASLLTYLDHLGLTDIHALLLSHADADHVDGAATLLTDSRYTVRNVFVNPDPIRRTTVWDDLKHALGIARRLHGTVLHSTLTTTDPGQIALDSVVVQVLGPSPEMAISGPMSRLEGDNLTANTNSAVLKVVVAGRNCVLLPGDVDATGLDRLVADDQDLAAPVLVFPHHGGRPGAVDPAKFAIDLCSRVQPEQVIFSIGRSSFRNPRPEIVEAIRTVTESVYIACTQLSRHCVHAEAVGQAACAGTIVIDLPEVRWRGLSQRRHSEYVNTLSMPLCKSLPIRRPSAKA